jgi:hypothetical protein
MSRSIIDHPEFNPDWDVLRDMRGAPITITEDQLWAIWRAINVVEDVRRSTDHPSLWENPSIDLLKSRLLGRMLLEGRPPTRTMPPTELGGPAWSLLPGGDPFDDETRDAEPLPGSGRPEGRR